MFGYYKKFLGEIKEFKKYKKRQFDTTIVNCRATCKFRNSYDRCTRKAIIIDSNDGKTFKCIFND